MEFLNVNVERTIQSYEFTIQAVAKIHRICDTQGFAEAEPEKIMDFFMKQIQPIPFSDYLKRYLYLHAELTIPFAEVPDKIYETILRSQFKENRAPYTFAKNTRRESSIIRGWLTAKAAKRETVFILGFGLGMTDTEVSEFLQKGIMEEDFNFTRKEELIYWYCYRNHLPYAEALEFLDAKGKKGLFARKIYSVMDIRSEKDLLNVLISYEDGQEFSDKHQKAWDCFNELYREVQHIMEHRLTMDPVFDVEYKAENEEKKKITERISGYVVEQVLYNGIPRDSRDNMIKASLSTLSPYFSFRLHRKRILQILEKKLCVTRNDLITLCFYKEMESNLDKEPWERLTNFINSSNCILENCGMNAMYPAFAYECFLIICSLTTDPFSVFSDILELSYGEQTAS